MNVDPKQHWENVYQEKEPGQVSWYQTQPKISLDMIRLSGISQAGKIIDVGGGASVLVDKLLDNGFDSITVLDISLKALEHAKKRLGQQAESVVWIEADITKFDPPQHYDLWHDRAVFHFLVDSQDRRKYVRILEKALNPGGHVIIGTFSLDGPLKCSGLDVERYDVPKLKEELGGSFELVKSMEDVHVTPWNKEQKFLYCYFKKIKKD